MIGIDNLTDFFKVLSDDTRLRILVLLYNNKLCVCEMCRVTGESQPKISKHLAKLRDMGFVKDERQEQYIYYELNIENKIQLDILKSIAENVCDYHVLNKDKQKCGTLE